MASGVYWAGHAGGLSAHVCYTQWDGDWMQSVPFCRIREGFKPSGNIPDRSCLTCLNILNKLLAERLNAK